MTLAQDGVRNGAAASIDELRGRLEAYHAKAAATGVADEPDVARAYALARRRWTEQPSRMLIAEQLVSALPDVSADHAVRRESVDDRCAPQPGCTGTIVDGYCDVCGSPGPSSRRHAARVPPGARPADPPPARPAGGRQRRGLHAAGLHRHHRRRLLRRLRQPRGRRRQPGLPPDLDRGPVGSGRAGVGVDHHPRLEPAGLDGARLAAGRSRPAPRSPGGCTPARQRLRSARLGAGLTRVPPAPVIDASQAIMKNPQVPEDKRFCPNCGAPVGRSRDGQPGRAEGFCPKCGNAFSFTPKLQAG